MFEKQNLAIPFGDVFRRIATQTLLIVYQSQFATLFTWGHSIEADVKLGAIGGICVFWMRIRKAEGVFWTRSGRTRESTLQTFMVYENDAWVRKKVVIIYILLISTVKQHQMQQVKAILQQQTFIYFLPALQDDLSVSVGQLQTPRSGKKRNKKTSQVYICTYINAAAEL